MALNVHMVQTESPSAKIKVLGIGGGGGNAVNDMIRAELAGVDFIAANTDANALSRSLAAIKIQLGQNLTRGLGAGGDPEVGRDATMEDADRIREVLNGAEMVFITAGLGGGTGTGGAPIIAEISKDVGALTVAVVTKPFFFEGKRRMRQAEAGVEELKKVVDTLITIPNDRLLSLSAKNTSGLETFAKANEVLLNAVKGISDIIIVTGHINVDFKDVRAIMSEKGMALMGTGIASGSNRAVEAAQKAISSPLLEDLTLQGARGILINITSGQDFSLDELKDACSLIQEEAHEDANIKFGWVVDDNMGENVKITVIGTGIGKKPEPEKVLRPARLRPESSPEELEIPTIIRKEAEFSRFRERTQGEHNSRGNVEMLNARKNVIHPDLHYEEDELDVPTFLRQAD